MISLYVEFSWRRSLSGMGGGVCFNCDIIMMSLYVEFSWRRSLSGMGGGGVCFNCDVIMMSLCLFVAGGSRGKAT